MTGLTVAPDDAIGRRGVSARRNKLRFETVKAAQKISSRCRVNAADPYQPAPELSTA
jgi:hypothetical protein